MRSDRDRLRDILEAVDRIKRHTTGGVAAFQENELIQNWVVHHLQIIGEAAARLSDKTRSQLDDVPWRSIIGMRNVLVHGYFDVDLDVVWAVVERDLDTLEGGIRASLDDPATDVAKAERRFNAEMVSGAETLKREVGYNPTRFLQMVGEYGGVGAARRLLEGTQYSEGFTTLWEKGRLRMSVEACALLPWYRGLFTDEQLRVARQRLHDHNFDVDAFVEEARKNPPAWWMA